MDTDSKWSELVHCNFDQYGTDCKFMNVIQLPYSNTLIPAPKGMGVSHRGPALFLVIYEIYIYDRYILTTCDYLSIYILNTYFHFNIYFSYITQKTRRTPMVSAV